MSTEGRDSGKPEAERRQDGAGRREPQPGGEAARGNVEPEVDAPEGSAETWTAARGTAVSDPANGGAVTPRPEGG